MTNSLQLLRPILWVPTTPARTGGMTRYVFSRRNGDWHQAAIVYWVVFIYSSKLLSAQTVQQASTSSIRASMATPSCGSQLTSSRKVSCSSPSRSTHLPRRCLTYRFLHTPRRIKSRVAKPVSLPHLLGLSIAIVILTDVPASQSLLLRSRRSTRHRRSSSGI